MPLGFRRRPAPTKSRVDAATLAKAVATAVGELSLVEKAYLTGSAGAMPVTNNLGNSPMRASVPASLIQRVTQTLGAGFNVPDEELEVALAAQGLSWGPPFPPGRPLDPFFGYQKPPRTYSYSVGENVQITPRWNRVSFPTIKAIYDAYDVAQICVRHLINDVRSLDYSWEPIPGTTDDVETDIEKARAFFNSPDKRQPFRSWLAEYLQDVLRYDAGTLYVRRNGEGDPIALEVVDGTTIIPIVDFYGRVAADEDDENAPPEGIWGGDETPAYVQIVQGMPWVWMVQDDIIYQPWNPLPDSQYGLAPLEAVLITANTDIRFQWHFLQYFTEGTVPAGFMEAPPDMKDPAEVAEWQDTWDAVMMGDQSKIRQIRWVPNGAKFSPSKKDADDFNEQFPLYLMRRVAASFGVTPNDLGFTENVNKSSGDSQQDVQFRVGTLPLVRHVEDVINLFVTEHLKLRCQIAFDTGRETEDRVAVAQADKIYIDCGVISVDEPRKKLGYPINKQRPTGRFVNNARTGPVPLIALESLAGEVDAETYGPADSQKPVSTPFVAVPGIAPAMGTPEALASAQTSAQIQRNLLLENAGEMGKNPQGGDIQAKDTTQPAGGPLEQAQAKNPVPQPAALAPMGSAPPGAVNTPASPPPPPPTGAALQPAQPNPKLASGKPATKELLDLIDQIVDAAAKELASGATTITGGISVATNIQGSGLDDDDEDDDEDAVKSALDYALSLRRWRSNSRNRLRKGRAPRRFVDPDLPDFVADQVWKTLERARTREEVDAAFASAGKASASPSAGSFHRHTDQIVAHYTPRLHDALKTAFPAEAVRAATRAAYRTVIHKSAAPAPPNLRAGTDAEHCGNCTMFDDGKCWGYGNFPVDDDQVCDSWEAEGGALAKEVGSAVDQALAMLQRALTPEAVNALEGLLASLYGDAALQGAHAAAAAVPGAIASGYANIALPLDYWSNWTPGYGDAAAKVAGGGLQALLDNAGQTIQGVTSTTMGRLGDVIAQGLANGDPVSTTANNALALLDSPTQAATVADTEYARAMTESSMDTYTANGVAQVNWLAEDDACELCLENEDASPIDIDDDWPNGSVPAHPLCRCAVAPVVDLT